MALLINGEFVNSISPFDRGFTYGDGLFETLLVVRGKLLQWPLHYERLKLGCQRLSLPLPSEALLLEEFDKLSACSPGNIERAIFKIILTRGQGERGYAMRISSKPTRLLTVLPWPDYSPSFALEGIDVLLCKTLSPLDVSLAGLKTLNRLPQILARQEVDAMGCAEGIMQDINGHVISGTSSNLFMVQGRKLITPSLERGGIAGITRRYLLSLCDREALEACVNCWDVDFMMSCDEAFCCNSIFGIWPIKRLLKAGHLVKSWSVGPVTRSLQQALSALESMG